MSEHVPIRRQALALFLIGALPALNGVIPVLDMKVGDGSDAVESHHIPGTHGFAHDHFICIQQQANQWAPAAVVPLSLVARAFALPPLPYPDVKEPSRLLLLPRSRAPPLV